MTAETELDRLARHRGVESGYRDAHGDAHRVSEETKRALLSAMGLSVEDEAAIAASARSMEDAAWRRPLEPVLIAIQGEPPPPIPIVVAADRTGSFLSWTVEEESGPAHHGQVSPANLPLSATRMLDGSALERRIFHLPVSLPVGYHRFRLTGPAVETTAAMDLIVAPPRCHMPESLEGEGRAWGIAVQLYALRSERNWGIGDFTDLRRLVESLAPLGVGVVGVNPLHALFPENPDHVSPYSPASRLFLNILYIDVEAVADFAECETARALVDGMRSDGRLDRLRESALIDYVGVAAAKRPVLEALYESFQGRHLAGPAETDRARRFREFQARGGQALETFALFEALSEHFRGSGHGWRRWPAAYHDPASPAVTAFAAAHRDRIAFFQYLQWQADLQLQAVAEACARTGMRIGLYRDLALGVDSGGADIWAQRSVFADGVSLGAPPDAFNSKGQNWGLPPIIPHALRDSAYRPLIDVLRANMRHTGALRIDHILGFMRLFWVPEGGAPSEGGYVHNPLADMLSVLALESVRNRCLVIGEDLGTVPEGLVDRLRKRGVLSYRLLYFEQTGEGDFLPPEAYPSLALVAVTTHDLPTLPGYWSGHDIDLRARLDLFATGQALQDARRARDRDRHRLLEALRGQGLLPLEPGSETGPGGAPSDRLVRSIYRYLARTPAKLLMVSLEDVLGEENQANLPGTTDAYPNWRRKLPLDLDRLLADPRMHALASALRDSRPAAPAGGGAR